MRVALLPLRRPWKRFLTDHNDFVTQLSEFANEPRSCRLQVGDTADCKSALPMVRVCGCALIDPSGRMTLEEVTNAIMIWGLNAIRNPAVCKAATFLVAWHVGKYLGRDIGCTLRAFRKLPPVAEEGSAIKDEVRDFTEDIIQDFGGVIGALWFARTEAVIWQDFGLIGAAMARSITAGGASVSVRSRRLARITSGIYLWIPTWF
jgi:hypothetical protein